MNENSFPIPCKPSDKFIMPGSVDPVRKVAIIGHGHLAERQKPTYEHWQKEGVEVHCADTDAGRLDDCVAGVAKYFLPADEKKLLSMAPFDILCVNNIPEVHLATALSYHTYARHVIIQKPQDLNFPLIRTVSKAMGFEQFQQKVRIHDHYRNKSLSQNPLQA